MRIAITPSKLNQVASPTIVYREEDHSFDCILGSHAWLGGASATVGTLELMVDLQGHVIGCCGYSPRSTWGTDIIRPAAASRCGVQIINQSEWLPGCAYELSDGTGWVGKFDEVSGWWRLARSSRSETLVSVFESFYLGVTDGELEEIFLHPTTVPN